jgi:hypothetical protein
MAGARKSCELLLAKVSGGPNLRRATSVRLTPVPTAERGSERDDGGGVRVPRVNGVGQLLCPKRYAALIRSLQPNVARDPGDEYQQRLWFLNGEHVPSRGPIVGYLVTPRTAVECYSGKHVCCLQRMCLFLVPWYVVEALHC